MIRLTKQERQARSIGIALVRAIERLETYDGNPDDVIEEAKLAVSYTGPAGVRGVVEALEKYYADTDVPVVAQVQTSGPQCKRCGAFTTYARVNTIGLCMKCERETKEEAL